MQDIKHKTQDTRHKTQDVTYLTLEVIARLLRTYVFFTISLFMITDVIGQQTYPVRSTISVKYPSVFLDEYADITNTTATITLLDLQKSNYRVLVKLTMESPDLKLSTKDMIPLTLNGGIPVDLDFADPTIAKLFSFDNLVAEKGKVAEFNTNKTLPEGLYLIKIEVYDANFPTINVSNANANIAAILVQLFDPPMLNLPQDKSSVNQDPLSMNLFFSWTPRSLTSNPNIQIYYQITMVEVPEGRVPYDAINIAGKVYPITMLADSGLTFPTFSFTPEQFPTVQGRTYAWQVIAYEQDLTTGNRRYERFRNRGRSEVYTFTVQENCPQIDVSSIFTNITTDKINITWDKGYGHTEYELNYRELGSVYQWTPIRSLVTDELSEQQTVAIDISNLEKGIQYEFKIAAKCKSWQPDVYGGVFSIQKQDCAAPEPITIQSTPTGVVVSWDPTENSQKYRLRYKGGNDALENEQTIEVTNTTTTLPALQTGKTYQIILDAVCVSGNLDLGKPYTIHENDNGYAGGCPIPQPFKIIVDHVPGVVQTSFKWSFTPGMHKSFKFSLVRKDLYDIAPSTVAWAEAVTAIPQINVDTLVEDRIYAYKVDYICDNGQKSTTAVGYFKLEKEPTVSVNPGTGDCFPPATRTAEGESATSASFEWGKSDGAEEYQLFYAPQNSNDFKVFNTTQKNTTIDNLDITQTHIYKYKIRARCPNAKYSLFTDTALVDLDQRYTGSCTYTGVFRSDRQSAHDIRLVWKHTASMAYTITYEQDGQSGSNPYTIQIDGNTITQNNLLDGDSIRYTVTDLDSKTDYVFHLQPICGTDNGKKIGPLDASTLEDATNGACGDGKVVCDSKSTTPLNPDSLIAMTKTSSGGLEYYEYEKASNKSIFSAADVEIIALDPLNYDAATKTFSGTGVAKLDLDLGNVGQALTGGSNVNLTDRLKTSVSFTNIKINDARCLIGGAVDITGLELNVLSDQQKAQANSYVDQYNSVMKQLIDAGKKLSDALELAKNYTEQAENYLDGGQAYGNVKTGSIVPVPAGADYSVSGGSVKDQNGNTIATIVTPPPTLTPKDTTFCKSCGTYITFMNASDAKYDFDEYKDEYFVHRKVAREYKALRYGNGKYYYVSAKAIVEGKVDKVKVKTLNGYTVADLTFKSGAGVTYILNARDLTLSLAGGAAGDGQDIYVHAKSKGDSVVGRLLVANYPTVNKKVVFVTVGDPVTWKTQPGFSVANVKTEVEKLLNNSYNRIGINYTVELDDQTLKNDYSWDSNGDGMVQDSKSGFLDNDFTGEEKALANLYQSYFDDLDTMKAYLFFTPDGKLPDADLQGKMPRGSKGGYIFMNNSSLAEVAKTVAHELGHGPHSLQHLFNSDWLDTDADKSNAANLMAYNSGVDLIKSQWDIMHDPGVVLGFFEKDKDSQSKKKDFCSMINALSELTMDASKLNNCITSAKNTPNRLPQVIRHNYPTSVFTDDDETIIEWYLYRLYCCGIKVNVHLLGSTKEGATEFAQDKNDVYTYRMADPSNPNQSLIMDADYTIWIPQSGKNMQVVNKIGTSSVSSTSDNLFRVAPGSSNKIILNSAYTGIGDAILSQDYELAKCVIGNILNQIGKDNPTNTCMAGLTYLNSNTCWDGNSKPRLPSVKLSVNQTTVSENAQSAQVTVTLSQAVTTDATIDFVLSGTATRNSDYTMVTSVTVPAGQTSQSVTLTTVRDAFVENNETVIIDLDIDKSQPVQEPFIQQQETISIIEDPIPSSSNIDNIKTDIQLNGTTRVSWSTSAVVSTFKWKTSGTTTYQDVTPTCTGGNCYVDLKVSRTTEVNYQITITNPGERGSLSVESATGSFQGNDCASCLCDQQLGPIGKDDPNDGITYGYLWTVDNGTPRADFNTNKNTSAFSFKYDGKHVYTLTRTYARDGYNITDQARVLIDPLLNCTWFITATDNTLPLGSGPRIAKNSQTLEVVEPDSGPNNGIDAIIAVNDPAAPVNIYPSGQPSWNLNSTTFNPSSTNDLTHNQINNTLPKTDDLFNITALDKTESCSVRYFKENLTPVPNNEVFDRPVLQFYQFLSQGCDFLHKVQDTITARINTTVNIPLNRAITPFNNGINSLNNTLGTNIPVIPQANFNYQLPLQCNIQNTIASRNAEKFSDIIVVQDEWGQYKINFTGQIATPAVMGCSGSYQASPLILTYDKNVRRGGVPTVSLAPSTQIASITCCIPPNGNLQLCGTINTIMVFSSPCTRQPAPPCELQCDLSIGFNLAPVDNTGIIPANLLNGITLTSPTIPITSFQAWP